jgi:hypothetical protein|tara:strand:+ start:995 stop:1186 length:192 start_codon:yes stop_codon:yes gene_type:complete
MADTQGEAQRNALKREFERAIKKRQDHIINRAVSKYRDNLTAQEAFAVIASIAELRSTVNDIG